MIGGAVAGVGQIFVWGDNAFPMVFIGGFFGAMAVGVGGGIWALSKSHLTRVTAHSLLTSEREFREFLRWPEDAQLRHLETHPDLAEFVDRLGHRLATDHDLW